MVVRNHFSGQLEAWLGSSKPKTMVGLVEAFAEKSFATIFLILMLVPALPLPTGGVTHVFELVVMLVALELMIGRRTIWLPKRWLQRQLGPTMQEKTLPRAIKIIKWFERFSRPRLTGLLSHPSFLVVVGGLVLILSLAAFVAPPFSGLDTLPSIGVVLISLALILEDVAIFAGGLAVGTLGVAVEIGLGAGIYSWIFHRGGK
jgi:hypothetical protein